MTQSCWTLCEPMDYSTPAFLVLHHLPEHAQTHVHLVSDAFYLILCHPHLLLPSIFPSIRVFSSELTLCIRWPKYWSFSFNISLSNEYSELIYFRIDWHFKRFSKVFSNTIDRKHQFFSVQHSLWYKSHTCT